MTILGLDFGEKRIGVAISRESFAFEYATLNFIEPDSLIKEIAEICKKENIKKIVLGLAKTHDGKIGFEAKKQKEFGKKLSENLQIPIVYEYEAFSSKESERILREQNLKPDEISKLRDQKAAQLILESYLEKEGN